MSLPAPTGPYPVGTTSLHLTDRGRPDPWVGSRPYRELMVSVRYPARNVAGHPRAPQMLPGEAAGFDAMNNLTDIPKGRVGLGGHPKPRPYERAGRAGTARAASRSCCTRRAPETRARWAPPCATTSRHAATWW